MPRSWPACFASRSTSPRSASNEAWSIGKLVVDAYADRRTKDSNLLEFLKLLESNGQLDRLPIDGKVLVSRMLERFGGTDTAIDPAVAGGAAEPGPPLAVDGVDLDVH